jgi:hypothetical protein
MTGVEHEGQPAQRPHDDPLAETILQALDVAMTVDGKRGHLDFVLGFVCRVNADLAGELLWEIEHKDRP